MTIKSLAEQAAFVQGLCERTWSAGGEVAGITALHLSQEDVASLEALARGLELLAIYDAQIKQVIVSAQRKKSANR